MLGRKVLSRRTIPKPNLVTMPLVHDLDRHDNLPLLPVHHSKQFRINRTPQLRRRSRNLNSEFS